MKTLIHTAILASLATVGLAATPAMAQGGYYDRDGYYRAGDDRNYNRGYDNRSDDRRYDNRRYDDRGGYADRRSDRSYQRCRRSSGTTGTIIGAIAGGLLGREIGRGGYGNSPSTTGLIIGGGVGALAGREIDKSSSCNRR